MSEWIKVEDKLPEIGQRVLTWNGEVQICEWDEGWLAEGGWYSLDEIRSWQPLPPPPKGEGEDE